MRYFIAVLMWAALVVVGVLGSNAGLVSAHVLNQNNGVSAVLHILPDDAPVAGVATRMELSFSAANFKVGSCECQLVIMDDADTITTAAITQIDTASERGKVSVTFPKAGVYTLQVQGNTGVNTPFRLEFIVRVTESKLTATAGSVASEVLLISAASLALLYIIAQYNIGRGGRYRV